MTTPTPEAIEPSMATSADFRKGYYAAMAKARTELVPYTKAEALREAANEIRNHPRLRKTQSAWLYYPESMAAKEKYYLESAAILDARAATIEGKDS